LFHLNKEEGMQKKLVVLALVALFAIGLTVGIATPSVQATPGLCWAWCHESGVWAECCPTQFGVLCWLTGNPCP
jgi:hypothetical protein